MKDEKISWEKTEKGRESNRRSVQKYIASEKGKRTRKLYQQKQGKEKHRLANARYDASLKGQINQRLWNKGLSKIEKEKARQAWLLFDGKCQCCGTIKPTHKGWCLDHKEGKFRGIICQHCNCAAGHLEDNIIRCLQLIIYLRRGLCL